MAPVQVVADKAEKGTISAISKASGADGTPIDPEHGDPRNILIVLGRTGRAYLELPRYIVALARNTGRLCELITPLLAALESALANVESMSKPLGPITKPPSKAR